MAFYPKALRFAMLILALITALALIISFIFNCKKTLLALKKAAIMLANLIFPFIKVLIIVSLVLMFFNKEMIIILLGEKAGGWGVALAALLGSVSLIPGFIAFPLAALLLKLGVAYMNVAVFLTSLLMVGIVTLPLEAKYFGWKVSLLRNTLSLVAAVLSGLMIGLVGNIL